LNQSGAIENSPVWTAQSNLTNLLVIQLFGADPSTSLRASLQQARESQPRAQGLKATRTFVS